MTLRIGILIACFLSAAAVITQAAKSDAVPIRQPLSTLPLQLQNWRGFEASALDDDVVAVLGVDDYINRIYVADGRSLGFYIGFYESQRTGSTIHSPLNCLPGSGWNPIDRRSANIQVASGPNGGMRAIQINRIMIQRGGEKQIVMYWYQSHGRVIGNEYWGKIYTVVDALKMKRTDAALVRIVSPVTGSDSADVEKAEHSAVEFIQTVFPSLSQYLPD
jgi:EpsI family protein